MGVYDLLERVARRAGDEVTARVAREMRAEEARGHRNRLTGPGSARDRAFAPPLRCLRGPSRRV